MTVPKYYLDAGGNFSGGGGAFLDNAALLREQYSELFGSERESVRVIPRNIPSRRLDNDAKFVLVPQNAWPYVRPFAGGTQALRWCALRAGSEFWSRRAAGMLRISEAIPPRGNAVGEDVILHNVLDRGFEGALEDERVEDRLAEVPHILAIGSIHGYRNFERLVIGYADYRSRGGALELHIYGDGLKQEIARLLWLASKTPGVRVRVGSLRRSECIALARKAHGVVAPSLVEASPFTLLESYAVNSNVAFSNIQGNVGVLAPYSAAHPDSAFDPSSVRSISRALSLLEDGIRSDALHAEISNPSEREKNRDRWCSEFATWLEGIAQ